MLFLCFFDTIWKAMKMGRWGGSWKFERGEHGLRERRHIMKRNPECSTAICCVSYIPGYFCLATFSSQLVHWHEHIIIVWMATMVVAIWQEVGSVWLAGTCSNYRRGLHNGMHRRIVARTISQRGFHACWACGVCFAEVCIEPPFFLWADFLLVLECGVWAGCCCWWGCGAGGGATAVFFDWLGLFATSTTTTGGFFSAKDAFSTSPDFFSSTLTWTPTSAFSGSSSTFCSTGLSSIFAVWASDMEEDPPAGRSASRLVGVTLTPA